MQQAAKFEIRSSKFEGFGALRGPVLGISLKGVSLILFEFRISDFGFRGVP
jgi:hypothetical protein